MAGKTMTWEEFANAKQTRERTSKYLGFITDLKPKSVANASEKFPGIKSDTLRGALYGAARKVNRKVTCLIRDDVLFIALAEAPDTAPKTAKK